MRKTPVNPFFPVNILLLVIRNGLARIEPWPAVPSAHRYRCHRGEMPASVDVARKEKTNLDGQRVSVLKAESI